MKKRWKALSPEKQERIRQRFEAFRQLPPNKTGNAPRETSLVSGFTSGTPPASKKSLEKLTSPTTGTNPKSYE